MKNQKNTKKRAPELKSIEIGALENVTGAGLCSSDAGSPLPACTYGK
jgi:hypothetical protein